MIKRYSERLAELELLQNRLLLSFRTDDDDYILSVCRQISDTGLNLKYNNTDYIFHYINCCSYHREPSFIVIGLLLSLQAKKTVMAYRLFKKLYIDKKDSHSLTDNIQRTAGSLLTVMNRKDSAA
ncbi:TPA: hypothetical protein OW381_005503 [Klebsiella oxytoca]|nr:hypothetical protein [Klebsiella oxytoca]HCW0736902.1 hypothetical protein [Klebsiella oxytoca]